MFTLRTLLLRRFITPPLIKFQQLIPTKIGHLNFMVNFNQVVYQRVVIIFIFNVSLDLEIDLSGVNKPLGFPFHYFALN